MRAALISIAAQPRDAGGGHPLGIAGQSLARRQLGFALAAGCQKIVVLGNGSSAEAISLRHAAENAGARFIMIGNCHGLLGTVRASDELLVLAPGLLPEDPGALELLERGNTVLVLPSGLGVSAGFERIDLVRAWAGAMVLPGNLVERLADLPEDADPTTALLRIALQAETPERRLGETVLADGGWTLIRDDAQAEEHEQVWLKRHLPPLTRNSLSRFLVRLTLQATAPRLLAAPRTLQMAIGGALFLLIGGLLAAWQALPAVGFGLVAFAALLGSFATVFARLRAAPYVREPGRFDPVVLVPIGVDVALLLCAVAAMGGGLQISAFAPLMLIGVLHATRIGERTSPVGLAGDRFVLAISLCVATAFGAGGPAIMCAALLVVLLAAVSRAS